MRGTRRYGILRWLLLATLFEKICCAFWGSGISISSFGKLWGGYVSYDSTIFSLPHNVLLMARGCRAFSCQGWLLAALALVADRMLYCAVVSRERAEPKLLFFSVSRKDDDLAPCPRFAAQGLGSNVKMLSFRNAVLQRSVPCYDTMVKPVT